MRAEIFKNYTILVEKMHKQTLFCAKMTNFAQK